ncbi:MAG: L-aspartate oxidase [Prochlorothrix sp.]
METGAEAERLDGRFDVIIVGAGAAGLYAALELPVTWQVALITKDDMTRSASDWAQGGIAAVVSSDDSPELHIQDTLKAGAGLCDPVAVEFLVYQAQDCVESLVELGVAFDRRGTALALTREAAHSRARVLHAADTTGRAVVTTLMEQVQQRPNITVLAQSLVLDLWLTGTGADRRCQGVQVLVNQQVQWLRAGAVVLATGGGGQVFAHTTNPLLSTGDGVAIGPRAGALLRDLEFFQFHPTALMHPEAACFLISEAVRGEGAQVRDAQGDRFLFRYHPDGELAPRDVVSRAIFQHLQILGTPQGHVFLDLRSIDPDRVRYRFPNIIQVCQHWGIDLFQEPIPVAPAAHYWMGGVATDLQGQTSIAGLYAVGEVASTGVHGANRLASNSLLECLVFGCQLQHLSLPEPCPPPLESPPPQVLDLHHWDGELAWMQEIRQALPQCIWQSAGICREAAALDAAITQVETWRSAWVNLGLSRAFAAIAPGQAVTIGVGPAHDVLRQWGELGSLLDIGILILKSAAFRQESRGGHHRLDYPDSQDSWQVHTLVQGDRWFRSDPIVPSSPS